MTMALAVVAALMAVALALCVAELVARDRELARIARFLGERDPASNARVTLRARGSSLVALARAINAELDRERDRRVCAEREQGAFQQDLASLSHDIRTPLAGAQGYLQLAQRVEDAGERERYLVQAGERLSAMRALVDGLFEYAKANDSALALDLVPVALMPELSEALVSFYPQFCARGWEPRIACAEEAADARALADAEALGRVLENLVANALRYGSGAPAFEVLVGPAAPGELALRVSNPVEHPERIDAARLFERFYKSDASRAGEGSGLGLAIVARLVAAMGGRASATVADGWLTIEVALRRV